MRGALGVLDDGPQCVAVVLRPGYETPSCAFSAALAIKSLISSCV